MDSKHIRNFCIIAHIDHGKSTLADRLLEITGTIDKRALNAQHLDQMDLERERGITIKLQPVKMKYTLNGEEYILNLIDTPGHVDFAYEVSRSLAACEGALLLVDASQGVQAQTLANLYLAIEQNLTIIPVINKIDLPNAQVERSKEEIVKLLGVAADDILLASGKTGEGVVKILEQVIKQVPPPVADRTLPPRALIFDSVFDDYRGVVAYVRMFDGVFRTHEKIAFVAAKEEGEALEVGHFSPKLVADTELRAGEIGYIVTGQKDVKAVRVGDTVTSLAMVKTVKALHGYKEIKPMVFAGIFAKSGQVEDLREAINKLKLNDASLSFEPEHSQALGFGFRCGFLGLLHLEIFSERLRREYNLDLIITTPSVGYLVTKTSGETLLVRGASELPNQSHIADSKEPWMKGDIVSPAEYLGKLMDLIVTKRGIYKDTEYLDEHRVIVHFELPLGSLLVDFYDRLKSVSQGFASLNYEFLDYRPVEIQKLDILVADEPAEALAAIVYKDEAQTRGRELTAALKETLPKQQFEVKIQAVLGYQPGKGGGGKVIASERISALRKDVTAKLYGGDVTRKNKLLDKQKKRKKEMAGTGHVDIPSEVYIKMLSK